jgi:hypothetical protein
MRQQLQQMKPWHCTLSSLVSRGRMPQSPYPGDSSSSALRASFIETTEVPGE